MILLPVLHAAVYLQLGQVLVSRSQTLVCAQRLVGERKVIRQKFLSFLTGQNAFINVIRELMALPVWLRGLGITNLSADASSHYDVLTVLIMEQSHQYSNIKRAEHIAIKNELVTIRRHCQSQTATELKSKLLTSMKKAMDLSSEKGGSNWLSTLPILDHRFALHTHGSWILHCILFAPDMAIIHLIWLFSVLVTNIS